MRFWTAVVAVAFVGALVAGCGGEEPGEPKDDEPVDGNSTKVPPRAAGAYFLGSSFEGLPLTDVLVPPRGAGSSTSFIYGDCEPPDEGGCAPPLEIQTWGICERFPSARMRSRLVSFRGTKALFDPTEAKIEIYTGRKTVVIFATEQELRRRAAEQVQPADDQADDAGLALPTFRARSHCQLD